MKYILLSIFVALMLMANGQVTIYRTYEDFTAKKGEKYDDYKGFMHVLGKVKLSFIKDKEVTKIACKDMWGFEYKNILFRIDHEHQQAACCINTGKICYYENGLAHLEMLRDNTDKAEFSVGYFSYISSDLNSELVPLPIIGSLGTKKAYLVFKGKNPKHKVFYDCIEKNFDYNKVRQCVTDYLKTK